MVGLPRLSRIWRAWRSTMLVKAMLREKMLAGF
jgi:hypothetical protein